MQIGRRRRQIYYIDRFQLCGLDSRYNA